MGASAFDPLQPVSSLRELAGRREEMQRIAGWLAAVDSERGPGLLITGPTGRGKSSVLACARELCLERDLVMAEVQGTSALARPGQMGAAVVDACVVALTKLGLLERNDNGPTWHAQLAGVELPDSKRALLSRGAGGPLVASVLRYDLERLVDAARKTDYRRIIVAIDDLDDALYESEDRDALAAAITGVDGVVIIASARGREHVGSIATAMGGSLFEFPLDALDAEGTRELLLRRHGTSQPQFSSDDVARIHRASAGQPAAIVTIARLALDALGDDDDAAEDDGAGHEPLVTAEVLRRAHAWLVGRADDPLTRDRLAWSEDLIARIDDLDEDLMRASWLLTSFENLSRREIAIVVELQIKCFARMDAGATEDPIDFTPVVERMTGALEDAGLLTRQDDRYTLCDGDPFAQTYLEAKAGSRPFAGSHPPVLARMVERYLLTMLHVDLPTTVGDGIATWAGVRSAGEDLSGDFGLAELENLLRSDDAVGLLSGGNLWPYQKGQEPPEGEVVTGVMLDLSIRLTDDGPLMQRIQRFHLASAPTADDDPQPELDRWLNEFRGWLHERRIDVNKLEAVRLSPRASRVARGGLDLDVGRHDILAMLQAHDVQGALELQVALTDVADRVKDHHRWIGVFVADMYSRLGFLACVSGRPDLAEEAIDRAAAFKESGGITSGFLLHFNRANARAQRDEWAAAALELDRALALLDEGEEATDKILVLWIPPVDGFEPPSPTWHVVKVAAHELRDVTLAQKASYEAISGRWRAEEYWSSAKDLESVPAALRLFAWTGLVRYGDVQRAARYLDDASTAGAEVVAELEWVRARLAVPPPPDDPGGEELAETG